MRARARGWQYGGSCLVVLCVALATTLALPAATTAQTSEVLGPGRWYDLITADRGIVDPNTGQVLGGGGWTEDLVFGGTNAILSGLVTGLFRTFSDDGSFGEGFGTGAAGGAVTYLGKRLAAERFTGAGLLGRQIASVGGSLASNARDGRGALDRLTLQLGLGRLYWDRVESRVDFRPDIVTLYYTTLGVVSSRVGLDWSESLSAGAPVFVTDIGATSLDDNAAGRTFGGVVLMDVNARLTLARIGAHERVHVIQYDQQLALWGEAAERGLASMFGPRVAGALGRVDLGVGPLPFALLLDYLPRDSNPIEIEADYLERWAHR